MAEIVNIRQKEFEAQMRLIKDMRPKKVLMVILDEDDQIDIFK